MEALALERKAEQNRELKERLLQLKKERNAIILAHYYQRDEVQEVADFRGDSCLLAQKAAQTDADVIVFCGVHFMGESAKILAPNKTVIIPDERAGCPMADMVNVEGLRALNVSIRMPKLLPTLIRRPMLNRKQIFVVLLRMRSMSSIPLIQMRLSGYRIKIWVTMYQNSQAKK
jgi:quinolinate synthase